MFASPLAHIPMRILFYSQSSTVYGSPASLVNLVAGLMDVDPKLDMIVVIPDKGQLAEKLEQENIVYKILPHAKWVYNNNVFQRKLRANKLLAHLWLQKNKIQRRFHNLRHKAKHQRLVEEFKPDIIYVNSSIAPMGCYMAIENKIPFIWHHRETVNDPVTGFYLDNTRAFRKCSSKAVLHLHPSKFLKVKYLQFPGVNHKVIYNGVPNAPVRTRKRLADAPVRFGMVGRINAQKGQREVLQVFKELPQTPDKYEVHVFGTGPDHIVDELKNEFSGIKVFFRGFQEKPVVYEDLDYLIVSGRHESFGRVVAEANARGIPVIAIKSGALEETVKDGENGFLYESQQDLSQILQHLLTGISEDFYWILCRKARQYYLDHFSIEQCARAVHKEIMNLRLKA